MDDFLTGPMAKRKLTENNRSCFIVPDVFDHDVVYGPDCRNVPLRKFPIHGACMNITPTFRWSTACMAFIRNNRPPSDTSTGAVADTSISIVASTSGINPTAKDQDLDQQDHLPPVKFLHI